MNAIYLIALAFIATTCFFIYLTIKLFYWLKVEGTIIDKYLFENRTDGGVIEFKTYEDSVEHGKQVLKLKSRAKLWQGLFIISCFSILITGLLIASIIIN